MGKFLRFHFLPLKTRPWVTNAFRVRLDLLRGISSRVACRIAGTADPEPVMSISTGDNYPFRRNNLEESECLETPLRIS